MIIEKMFDIPVLFSKLEHDFFKLTQIEIGRAVDLIDWTCPPSLENTQKLSTSNFCQNWIESNNCFSLMNVINQHLSNYCKYFGFEDLPEYTMHSWVTCNEKGSYSIAHDHAMADVSGVYYYKTNSNDGTLYFNTPVNSSNASRLMFGYHMPRHVIPEEGKLVLFPGFLQHGVRTNTTDHTRISIAFNIFFDRTTDSSRYSMVFNDQNII